MPIGHRHNGIAHLGTARLQEGTEILLGVARKVLPVRVQGVEDIWQHAVQRLGDDGSINLLCGRDGTLKRHTGNTRLLGDDPLNQLATIAYYRSALRTRHKFRKMCHAAPPYAS